MATDLLPPEEAVRRARAALPAWAGLPAAQRAEHLARLRRAVARAADEIADVVAGETGRVPADVVESEVMHAAAHADFLARRAPRLLRTRRMSPRPVWTKAAWLAYRPLGVAAVVAPWNYPFLLPFLPTATALAAGCTVVLKPSEVAPASGALVAALARRAGLPPEVVTVLPGGPEAAAGLVGAGVDVVAVTGATATGRRVAELAARSLTPVVPELGGNDALLVLPGADLRRAARAAVWGGCFNAGQSCVAVERVIVVDAVYDAFLTELDRAVRAVTSAPHPRRGIGPLATDRQAAVVEDQLRAAVAAGARLRHGGGRAGRRVQPTVVTDVPRDTALWREETFGPVLAVTRVADTDAAVAAANDTAYGLAASVFTGDRATGREVAAALRCGAVSVNDALVNYAMPQLPFGGVGASGWGRQGGAEGLRAFCHTQTVTETLLAPSRELQWFPRWLGRRGWRRLVALLYGR